MFDLEDMKDNTMIEEKDFINNPKKTFDHSKNIFVINLTSGEYYVSSTPGEMIVTVLGSCISVCIFDPVSKIAGMNHFLLPGGKITPPTPLYGIFAMEYMINEVLKRGALKTRLEVKLFGGGSIIQQNSHNIGQKNIEFVQGYLADEGLKIVASDVGGDCARRVHFLGDSGKVRVNKIHNAASLKKVIIAEEDYEKRLLQSKSSGNVELFGD
jgi:chemotaxis protein CheD